MTYLLGWSNHKHCLCPLLEYYYTQVLIGLSMGIGIAYGSTNGLPTEQLQVSKKCGVNHPATSGGTYSESGAQSLLPQTMHW